MDHGAGGGSMYSSLKDAIVAGASFPVPEDVSDSRGGSGYRLSKAFGFRDYGCLLTLTICN